MRCGEGASDCGPPTGGDGVAADCGPWCGGSGAAEEPGPWTGARETAEDGGPLTGGEGFAVDCGPEVGGGGAAEDPGPEPGARETADDDGPLTGGEGLAVDCGPCCGGNGAAEDPGPCCGGAGEAEDPGPCCGGAGEAEDPGPCCGGAGEAEEPGPWTGSRATADDGGPLTGGEGLAVDCGPCCGGSGEAADCGPCCGGSGEAADCGPCCGGSGEAADCGPCCVGADDAEDPGPETGSRATADERGPLTGGEGAAEDCGPETGGAGAADDCGPPAGAAGPADDDGPDTGDEGAAEDCGPDTGGEGAADEPGPETGVRATAPGCGPCTGAGAGAEDSGGVTGVGTWIDGPDPRTGAEGCGTGAETGGDGEADDDGPETCADAGRREMRPAPGPLTDGDGFADDWGPLTDGGAGAAESGPPIGGGPGVAGLISTEAGPRPVSASMARRNTPRSAAGGATTMSATGAAGRCTEPRVARCMRGRTGTDCGAGSRRRSSIRTGAGRSPSERVGAGASRAGTGFDALRMIEGGCTCGVGESGTGSERADPAGLRETRLRAAAGVSGTTSAPGIGGRVGSAASRATDADGGVGSGMPDARPSTIRAPRLRCSFARPGFASGSRAIASSDIVIAFWASPSKIQAACQSSIPTGVSETAGAGTGAGGSAALRAISCSGAGALGVPGRGGLSLVAARSTRPGARAAATSPPRRAVAPRAGLGASRTGGRPRREDSSPVGVRSLGSISALYGPLGGVVGPVAFCDHAGECVSFREEVPAVSVLQVEDRVQRPVEVIGEAGRLRDALRRRRPRHFPNRPSSMSVRSTSNSFAHSGQCTTPTASPSVFTRS